MSKIAIIGSGVVGQATGKGFVTKGHDVTFVDINPKIINGLRKEGYQACFPNSLKEKNADMYFLVLPTPTVDGKIKLNFLKSATETLGGGVKR